MTSPKPSAALREESLAGDLRCAACGAALRSLDATLRMQQMALIACPRCASWTAWPRPTEAQQAALHDSADYFHHPYFCERRSAEAATRKRCQRIFEWLDQTGCAIPAPLKLLDVGCDTGSLLQAAARLRPVEAHGVDVSGYAVEVARQRGLNVTQATLAQLPRDPRFDLITAVDVLEHVPDPASLLREIFLRLQPSGYVYLQTPNIRSLIYEIGLALGRLGGARWQALERLFPQQHLEYFTPQAFRALAERSGLVVERLEARVLPAAELAVSLPMLALLMPMQLLDLATRRGILICALLRKPA